MTSHSLTASNNALSSVKPHYSQTLYRAFWFDVGVKAARCLGARGARRVGRGLGQIYGWTHPSARAAVRTNLAAVCGPPGDPRVVYRTFRNFGAAMADYLLLGTRTKQQARAFIEQYEGFDHILKAREHGRGVLLVTAHLGLFELGGVLLEDFNLPLVVLSRPEPSEALNQWRAAYRRRWNAETLEIGADEFAFVNITRQLAQGKYVAMLIDRPREGDDVVMVDLPHGRVPFSTGPVWLSLLTGAPLVPTIILATADGKYTVEAQPPLYLQWRGRDHAATIREFTVELAARFRETICAHPDQWYQFVPLSAPR